MRLAVFHYSFVSGIEQLAKISSIITNTDVLDRPGRREAADGHHSLKNHQTSKTTTITIAMPSMVFNAPNPLQLPASPLAPSDFQFRHPVWPRCFGFKVRSGATGATAQRPFVFALLAVTTIKFIRVLVRPRTSLAAKSSSA